MNFRNSTLRTQRQVRLPRLSVIHKKILFLRFSLFLVLLIIFYLSLASNRNSSSNLDYYNCFFILSVSNHLTTRICSSSHQKSSGHLTTKNCCSVFRTSYYQKSLLYIINYNCIIVFYLFKSLLFIMIYILVFLELIQILLQ